VTPEDCLRAGLKTMEERSAQHGGTHTFQMFGETMHDLFPKGYDIYGQEDWEELGLIMMLVHKLCRLTNNLGKDVTNFDNAHDMGNYAFILESVMRKNG